MPDLPHVEEAAELATAALGGRARLRVIVILAAVLGLSAADLATVGAVAPELEAALHIGNAQLGLLMTASLLVGAAGTLPFGVLVDRVRRERLLWAAILCWVVAMGVAGLSNSYLMLLLTRLGLGAVTAATGPSIASLVGDFFPAQDRSRVYGWILLGELIGAGFGLLISGDLAALIDWRASFWLLAAIGVAVAALVAGWLPEPARGGQSRLSEGQEDIPSAEDVDRDNHPQPADQEPPRDPRIGRALARIGGRPVSSLVLTSDPAGMTFTRAVRYVLQIRTNLVLILSSALGYYFLAGVRSFGTLYFRERYHLPQAGAIGLLGLVALGAMLGVLAGGFLTDRMVDEGRPRARILVPAIAFLVAAVLFVPALLAGTPLMAIPLLFLAALAFSATNPPMDAARLDVMHFRLWGRAESVRTCLRSLGEAAAPLLFGIVSQLLGARAPVYGSIGHSAAAGSGSALEHTFLVMLVPLALAGLVLWFKARETYPNDAVTAIASEKRTRSPNPGLAGS